MSAARVESVALGPGVDTARKAIPGQPAPAEMLIDPASLCWKYYARQPDPADPAQRVSFGTSGHRGSALHGTFNEAHVLAITQAICEFRKSQGVDGPLYIGRDTHALSEPAMRSAHSEL